MYEHLCLPVHTFLVVLDSERCNVSLRCVYLGALCAIFLASVLAFITVDKELYISVKRAGNGDGDTLKPVPYSLLLLAGYRSVP